MIVFLIIALVVAGFIIWGQAEELKRNKESFKKQNESFQKEFGKYLTQIVFNIPRDEAFKKAWIERLTKLYTKANAATDANVQQVILTDSLSEETVLPALDKIVKTMHFCNMLQAELIDIKKMLDGPSASSPKEILQGTYFPTENEVVRIEKFLNFVFMNLNTSYAYRATELNAYASTLLRRQKDLEREHKTRMLQIEKESKQRDRDVSRRIEEEVREREAILNQKSSELEIKQTELSELQKKIFLWEQDFLDRASILHQKMEENFHTPLAKTLGVFSTVLADAYAQKYEHIKQEMENKKRPAFSSAQIVADLKREVRFAEKQAKVNRYLVETYERMFPSLKEYREIPTIDAFQEGEVVEDSDPAELFLAPFERTSKELSSTEKFQKALDRYFSSNNKTNWEVGLMYERYIAYTYETEGWKIIMHGAKRRLEDMGIDVIATKEGITHLIQCKYWATGKNIHEKHIFQLFGTTIQYIMENASLFSSNPIDVIKSGIVKPIFITSTELSETAKKMAELLNVEVQSNRPLKKYPAVKCNNHSEHGKIYHLPFDQQYDNINMAKKDFYVETVSEAEGKGFRRAYRWRGGQPIYK